MPDSVPWFDTSSFMPHGHCYLWTPSLLWMHVLSDLLIGLAYLAIPVALLGLRRRRPDLPFNWIFVCFGVFIVACGATHFIEVWNVWNSEYWIAGIVKVITAAASVSTAILVIRLLPHVAALPSPSQLRAANAALATANSELESFSYSVSHDLRAPLRTIEGFGQILEEDHASELSDQGRRYVTRLRAEARRMSGLITDLLQLARISHAELHRVRIDLSAMALAVIERLHRNEPQRSVEIHVHPNLWASADPALANIALENLLGNAWKFTSHTTVARIDVGSDVGASGRPEFFVRDNGAGFDMAHAPKLFKAFERLHRMDEFPGTGVGLASTYRILRRHGGTISARASLGGGAEFRFSFD